MSQRPNNDQPAPPSKIFLEECFESADDQFLETLRKFNSPKTLTGIVEKWLSDTRPWARQQIIDYLADDLNLPGHEVVFKRIFKHFRDTHDHAMMGVLLVALDRIVRRTRVKRFNYDWSTRQGWTTERLFAKTNKAVVDQTGRVFDGTRWGRTVQFPLPDIRNKPGNRLFSHRTRNYLRRAVWRYFRWLSYREPDTYVTQITAALALYRDHDFWTGENIIDNWSLMHACYFHDPTITFTAAHTNLAAGHSLGQLTPHPYQPDAWKTDTARDALLTLLVDANSTLVRVWSIELFLKFHSSQKNSIELPALIKMLSSPDPHLQNFAQQIFADHPALPTLSVKQWLDLIEISHVNLLSLICDAMKQHVSESRLDNSQIMQLACAQQVPIAEFGFELLPARHKLKPLASHELAELADCHCAQQAPTITLWALEQLGAQRDYSADTVVAFFDASLRPTRDAAMTWLANPETAAYNDAQLWSRLIETPFDNVKLKLVELLNHRHDHPNIETEKLSSVWVAVVLSVHRGGRTKPKAIEQLADQIIRNPETADSLLPALIVAVRSVRVPEIASGLAALVRLAHASPELEMKISTLVPELDWMAEEPC